MTEATIEDLLAELFAEAERDGKWFHCTYQDLWFSPRELRKAQSEGRFRWGPVNWTLRDPQEYVAQHERAALRAAQDYLAARHRVKAEVGR